MERSGKCRGREGAKKRQKWEYEVGATVRLGKRRRGKHTVGVEGRENGRERGEVWEKGRKLGFKEGDSGGRRTKSKDIVDG